MNSFNYHILALLIGSILDSIIGDPHNMPHPIRLIGRWIAFLDRKLLGEKPEGDVKLIRLKGMILCVMVILPTALITGLIMLLSRKFGLVCLVIVEAILSFYFLAAKSLYVESNNVLVAYREEGIEAARMALSMIVGRDTEKLNITEIYKATIETIAENTSDGVFAPLFYMILLGPVGGAIYKAINTMDSMVGYHNERYEDFGYAAAKLDDIAGFIPSRLTGIYVIIISFIFQRDYNFRSAYRIFRRDRLNHKSPNSAQSEAAFAGALDVQLGGGAFYFGTFVKKPTIGDPGKIIEEIDVKKAGKLLGYMILVCQVIMLILMCVINIK